jgi:hypothetical protein
MTPEEITSMAKEAGIAEPTADGCLQFPWNEYVDLRPYLQHFAALVAEKAAAKKAEECAQVAMEFRRGAGDPVCGEVAAAIRARGQKGGV